MSSVRHEQLVAADGTRLALYGLGSPDGPTVILVPGTFSNHTFWLGTRGHGMAWALADAGFDVMVLDLRGHGGSERRDRRWTFEDWGRQDVTAALEHATRDGSRVLLVGHSAGGASSLIALAAEHQLRQRVAGLVALATPVPWLQRWRKLGAWMIRAVSRLLGRFPARLLGLGPEDELPGVMAQWMSWNLRGEWVGEDGTDYVEALADVRTPILAVSGAGDTVFAPPDACRGLLELVGSTDATYVLAGRETGFSEDFDHPGIVISKAAHGEVWPVVIDWLAARAPASRRPLDGDLHRD